MKVELSAHAVVVVAAALGWALAVASRVVVLVILASFIICKDILV